MSHVAAAVKALIEKDSRILLLKQKLDSGFYWDLPGGRVEPGESPFDCLRREVLEETSLAIEIGAPAGVWWFFRNDGIQVVCTAFHCSIRDGSLDILKNPANEAICEYHWADPAAAASMPVAHSSLTDLIRQLYGSR